MCYKKGVWSRLINGFFGIFGDIGVSALNVFSEILELGIQLLTSTTNASPEFLINSKKKLILN